MRYIVSLQRVTESAPTAPGNYDRLATGMKSLLVGEAKLKISSQDIYKMGNFCLDAQNLYTYIYLIHPTNTGGKQLLYTQIDNTTTPLENLDVKIIKR